MRTTALSLLAIALLAPATLAKPKTDPDVVKKVRALLSTDKEEEIDRYIAEIKAEGDWASVRAGLLEGPYYPKPLVTEFGERHSHKHMGLTWKGEDGRERAFSVYVPKSYDASKKFPVIVYLHHNASNQAFNSLRGVSALRRFQDLADAEGFLAVAPSTNAGAEWWSPEGRRLVAWTLESLKKRYNIDEDRVALMGAQDGGDAVWYLAQEMPDTWSCLLPMSSDPLETAGLIRPLYLGTLDRMPVLMGVPGRLRGALRTQGAAQHLRSLDRLFNQRMRITAAVFPTAASDFRYMDEILPQAVAFALEKKRKAIPNEVDIETDERDGQRSLWLESHGVWTDGPRADGFPSTLYTWTPPKETKEPEVKLGVNLGEREAWDVGVVVNHSDGAAQKAGLLPGDVILEIGGVPVKGLEDAKRAIQKHAFGDDVHLLLARRVRASRKDRVERREAAYREWYAKRKAEAVESGKWNDRSWSAFLEQYVEEDTGSDDDEGSGGDMDEESIFEDIGGDDAEEETAGGPKKEVERVFVPFERWAHLRRPEGPLVRADFGASWSPDWRDEGVQVYKVIPHGHAHRAGLRNGDVIVAVGDTPVNRVEEIAAYFKDYEFEKAPEGDRFVDFTVKRKESHDAPWTERTVTVRWDPIRSGRVDAQWKAGEQAMYVLARDIASFTIYFDDDLMEPGKEFHLYVNGIPYQDLVDPESTPDYPEGRESHFRADRMRRKRAKVEGWKPDIEWALRHALERRDRSLVFGAKRTFDLRELAAGFEASEKRKKSRRDERAQELRKAYEAYKAKG